MSAEDVQLWRYQHELTQLQLADLLMVSVLTIKRWEGGSRQPPWFLKLALERLEQLLNEDYPEDIPPAVTAQSA